MTDILMESARRIRATPNAPDFSKIISWPERWEHYKGTAWERQCLLSIADEADYDDPETKWLYCAAFDAATASDPDDRALFVEDVERIFSEWEAEENDPEFVPEDL